MTGNSSGPTPDDAITAACKVLAGEGKAGEIHELLDGWAVEQIIEILLRQVPRKPTLVSAL